MYYYFRMKTIAGKVLQSSCDNLLTDRNSSPKNAQQ
jgi:hypothetical protein